MVHSWCISTSHPLVTQIAEKYNLHKNQARTILNNARENDPGIQNDDISLEFLEQQKSFQDTLSMFVQKAVDTDDYLLQDPSYQKKEIKTTLEAVQHELSLEMTEDEVAAQMMRMQEMTQTTKLARLNASKTAKILKAFPDTRRLEFIGDWICKYVSEMLTTISTDSVLRKELTLANHNTRLEYIKDTDVFNTITDGILEELEDRIEGLREEGKDQLASELQAAVDNFPTMLFLYGGRLFRAEGIEIGIDGNMVVTDNEADSNERNDTDGESDESDEDISEQPVNSFSANEQNKSVTSKIAPDIKVLLSQIRDKLPDGRDKADRYGYGLHTYISVPLAVNKLLTLCSGCQTFREMFEVLKRNEKAVPWMSQLVTALDTNSRTDMSGETEVSSSKKEQLQSMFFQSMRKQHTWLRTSYMTYEGGNPVFENRDANVKHKSGQLLNRLRRKFRSMSGLPIFRNGMIDFDKLLALKKEAEAQGLSQEIAKAYSLALDAAFYLQIGKPANYKEALTALSIAEKHLQTILQSIGVDVSNTLMQDFLVNTDNENGALQSVFASKAQYGNSEFAIRLINLKKLQTMTHGLLTEFSEWWDSIQYGHSQDTPMTNPFARNNGNSDYSSIRSIPKKYMNIINLLTKNSPDSFESRAHINGKDYYSWNNPSSILTVMENLTADDLEKVKSYIQEKYCKDSSWFLLPGSSSYNPHFYSDWLEDIFHGRRTKLAYSEKPSFCDTDYEDQSDISYAISILNDYFRADQFDRNVAWYRMLIASDKPRYSSIRFTRYNNNSKTADGLWSAQNYHTIIADKAVNFFAQELRRCTEVIRYAANGKEVKFDGYDVKITSENQSVFDKIAAGQNVTVNDVVKNGRYIFRGSGAAFYMNKFILNEIESNSELGQYVVDRIFNAQKHEGEPLVTEAILPKFRDGFHKYMQSIKADFIDYLGNIGATQEKEQKGKGEDGDTIHLRYFAGAVQSWHSDIPFSIYSRREEAAALAKQEGIDVKDNPQYRPLFCELLQLHDDIEEFVYNNWLAKVNMSEIFDVDLAFYGNTTNFQKRNAQVISSGYVPDADAKIHGKKVSDGKYRSITLKTSKEMSDYIPNIEHLMKSQLESITDAEQRKQFELGMKDILGALKSFDPTDGQSFTGLTALRKRLAGQGEWSRSDSEALDKLGYVEDDKGNKTYISTDEAVYWRMKRGYKSKEDKAALTTDMLHVFAQVQKPFVYAFCNIERDGRTITVPIQHKNSEYAIIAISYFLSSKKPDSQLAAIAKFLEESTEDDMQTGIDTVNFDTAVKIGGNSETIDIGNMDGQHTIETLRKAVYGKIPKQINGKKQYIPGAVTEYDVKDYKIVQQKTEHFKHSNQPMGSQMKILAINNIKDDTVCTLPSGETITGKKLKHRYFAAFTKKMKADKDAFRNSMGLNWPLKFRLMRLSNQLKNAMSSDQKFTVEMHRSLSITERRGETQFLLPLDDPGQQSAVEAMLFSKIRKIFYRGKTKGGIVVQATSWGKSDDLAIRFYSSNPEDAKRGGVVPTLKEFAAEHNYGLDTEAKYKEYLKKYQKGYAWFEAEIPMPDSVRNMIAHTDGTVDEKYFNPDGTWDMEEIRKVVPDSVFDAICYRVPTEAKYSMMACRIKQFSSEASGSTAKYPKELTVFTGSDFDIDTDTIELRPENGSKSEDYDNELFDLQLAALRSSDAVQETFKQGDFSDLQDLSYRMTLLASGKFTKEEVDAMSTKEAKTQCTAVEDLDLMNPATDVILHNQNSDAKSMIAIAAVSVTSHAFLSLYNDISERNDESNPLKNPENYVRCILSEKGNNCQAFTVVNDKGDNPITMYFGGPVFLDMLHDMDGKLISTEISKYVGASADAAKDAAEYRLNINKTTLPVLVLMHRLGVSSDVARLFIAQPAIRQLVNEIRSNMVLSDGIDMNKVYETVYKNMANDEGKTEDQAKEEWASVESSTSAQLVYSQLVENIIHPEKQSLHDKMLMLHIFKSLDTIAKRIKKLDSFTRYNSSKAMKGSSFLDRLVTTEKLKNLMVMLNAENANILLPQNVEILDGFSNDEFGRLCSMFPYIAETVLGEEEMTQKLIIDTMHTYNSAFFDIAYKLYGTFSTAGIEKSLKRLYTGWKNYLLFLGSSRIADFSDPGVASYYTRDFARHFSETLDEIEKEHPEVYKKVIADNTFIDSIGYVESKKGYDAFDVLSTDITGMSDTVLEQYKRDWEALLNYPETRKLATDVAIHFLTRTTGFSGDTPVAAMPLAIKEAIPHYIEAFADADKVQMSEQDKWQFISLYERNNPDDTVAIPHFYTNGSKGNISIEKCQDYPSVLLKIRGNAQELSKWIDVNDNNDIIPNVPIISIKNKGEDELYLVNPDDVFEITKSTDGKNSIYSIYALQVERLGIPNQLLEYTGFPNEHSMFNTVGDSHGESAEVLEPIETDPSDSDIIQDDSIMYYGQRVGTFMENSPYGSSDIDGQYDKLLRNPDNKNNRNAFLESRQYGKRADKLAEMFGFKITAKQMMTFGESQSDQRYKLQLLPNFHYRDRSEAAFDSHTQAKLLASLVSTLGYQNSTPEVKTYVSFPENANGVEFSIKLNSSVDNEAVKKVIKHHDNIGLNVSEHEITATFRYSDNVGESLGGTREQIKIMKALLNELHEQGLTDSEHVEMNYVQDSVIDNEEKQTILNSLQNETESKQNDNAENPEIVASGTDDSSRKEVRVGDLAALAIRRLNGEKVSSEIREAFGEPAIPLRNTDVSNDSLTLADAVINDMSDNLYADVMNLATDNKTGTKTEDIIVDNLIINTANWIKGNRSQNALQEMLQRTGLTPQGSTDIMKLIEDKLNELDIC